MKSLLIYFTFLILLLSSCNNSEKSDEENSLIKEIAILEKEFFNDSLGLIKEKAITLINTYQKFYKKDSLSEINAKQLLTAGQIATSIKEVQQAVYFYDIVINRFSKTPSAPLALFQKAVLLDDLTQEDDLAKEAYQLFLTLYPKHSLAESAKESINLLGRPLEDIVKEFERKNANKGIEK